LSYRKEAFSRLKDRNVKRIEETLKSGQLTILFQSAPVLVTEQAVELEVSGQRQRIPNDFVWVFAGGEPPNDFLKKIGVAFGTLDVTAEAVREARLALNSDPVRA
jgi:thioredoxin reductase